jgi:hypothetical protein
MIKEEELTKKTLIRLKNKHNDIVLGKKPNEWYFIIPYIPTVKFENKDLPIMCSVNGYTVNDNIKRKVTRL